MFEGELKYKMQYGFSMFLQVSENHNRGLLGKRKYININTLERKMFLIGQQQEHFILVEEYDKTLLSGVNAMSSAENRAKVGASKIGRKIAINHQTNERRYVFPTNIPEGFVLKSSLK
jgi:hypothetical protein